MEYENKSFKKMLYNMKMTVMPIVTDTLGTIPKSLVRKLDEF